MRLWLCMSVAAVAAVAVTGASGGGAVATAAKPTLAVAVVGSGRVTSQPAGISCPGKCSATFAAGSRVLLTPKAKTGSRFLRWGGNCTGAGACRVRVSALAAVAAQFVGPKTQPPSKSSIEPGTYTGIGVTFVVPAGGGSVVNFTSKTYVACAGGGGAINTGDFKILKAAIKRDGTFTSTTSQNAVVDGANAKLTYFVTGRFQGRSATGAAAAAGVYRVDIVFTDTPNRKCTSNDQSWTAARSQPPQTKSIQPGTYTGIGVAFFVPAGARSVLNFTSKTYVACQGGGGAINTGDFKILTATIKGDRSFTGATSQNAVLGGANAKITYSVIGSFQGFSSAGAAAAAGVYRVDIVFTDTPNRRCTSNDQSWTAARTG